MEIDADLLGQSPALAAVREQVKGLLQRVAFGRLPAMTSPLASTRDVTRSGTSRRKRGQDR